MLDEEAEGVCEGLALLALSKLKTQRVSKLKHPET